MQASKQASALPCETEIIVVGAPSNFLVEAGCANLPQRALEDRWQQFAERCCAVGQMEWDMDVREHFSVRHGQDTEARGAAEMIGENQECWDCTHGFVMTGCHTRSVTNSTAQKKSEASGTRLRVRRSQVVATCKCALRSRSERIRNVLNATVCIVETEGCWGKQVRSRAHNRGSDSPGMRVRMRHGQGVARILREDCTKQNYKGEDQSS